MKTYQVTVEYRITKTYTVEAETEDDARQWVYGNGSVLPEEGVPESYDESILDVDEMT